MGTCRSIAQGCSEYNITVLIDGKDSVRALRAVHSRFYLATLPLAVGIVGPGAIGSTFMRQLQQQKEVSFPFSPFFLCLWLLLAFDSRCCLVTVSRASCNSKRRRACFCSLDSCPTTSWSTDDGSPGYCPAECTEELTSSPFFLCLCLFFCLPWLLSLPF